MHGPLNVKIHLRHILVEICVYSSIDRKVQLPVYNCHSREVSES